MGMILNPHQNNEGIKDSWHLLNLICIGAMISAPILTIYTPFLTRNVANRFLTLFYGLGSGITLTSSSLKLAKLQTRIKAIESYEIASFKHQIASDLYLTQATNEAIAETLLGERKESLQPVLTVEAVRKADYPDLLTGSANAVSSLGNGVSGNVSGNGNEAVINALATGKTDSWIIQNVLGMKGRNYS
ncbi:MAG: hypothetical protein ACRC8A_01820, partial [Microcoleaceae cyanobacterium]